MGNPRPGCWCPARASSDPRPMGEAATRSLHGQLRRRPRPGGRVRLRRAARRSRPGRRSTRPSGWSATSGTGPSSRGWCSATRSRARRRRSRCSASRRGLPGRGAGRARAAADRRASRARRLGPAARSRRRTSLDRRGESPLAVLADALATGEPVLAVCADVPRRLDGLSARVGGFALISYHALERRPALAGAIRADRGARPAVAAPARRRCCARRSRLHPPGVGRG